MDEIYINIRSHRLVVVIVHETDDLPQSACLRQRQRALILMELQMYVKPYSEMDMKCYEVIGQSDMQMRQRISH